MLKFTEHGIITFYMGWIACFGGIRPIEEFVLLLSRGERGRRPELLRGSGDLELPDREVPTIRYPVRSTVRAQAARWKRPTLGWSVGGHDIPPDFAFRVMINGPKIGGQGRDKRTGRVTINGPGSLGYTFLRSGRTRRNHGVPKDDRRTSVSDSRTRCGGRILPVNRRCAETGQENRTPVRPRHQEPIVPRRS